MAVNAKIAIFCAPELRYLFKGLEGIAMPYRNFIALFAACFMATGAGAADMNAPLNDKPTVGSEVSRGQDAAFHCGLDFLSDTPAVAGCVFRAVAQNKQLHANTLPFEVGVFYGAWCEMRNSVKTDIELASTNSVAAAHLPDAEQEELSMYTVMRHDQAQAGITDDQLLSIFTEMKPAARQDELARMKQWEASYPKAPDSGLSATDDPVH